VLLAADVSGDTDTQLLQPVAVEVALESDVASGSGFVAGDANGDGLLQPIDVLLIINAVNADGEMTLLAGDPMDVNVDGWLTLDDPIGAPDATPNDDGPARVPDWPVLNALPPGQLHDGMTEFEMGGKYGVGRYTITRQLECVPLRIEYHAALSAIDAEITVEFKNGWIFKHSAIPQARLLKHEQLHWSMAVYIAEKFDAIAKDVWATGTGVTEHEAKNNARMWANMKLDEINALHVSFQQRIQSRYDAETNGGELPQPGAFDHQLDWEATWQRKIDIDFDVYKNDHPELQPLPI